jgi:hypothetical protein
MNPTVMTTMPQTTLCVLGLIPTYTTQGKLSADLAILYLVIFVPTTLIWTLLTPLYFSKRINKGTQNNYQLGTSRTYFTTLFTASLFIVPVSFFAFRRAAILWLGYYG